MKSPITEIPTSKKKLDRKLLSQLWQLIMPYKWELILAIIILLLAKGIVVLVPLGIKYGIEVVENSNIDELTRVCLFLIGVLVFQFLATFWQIYLTNSFGQKVMRDLRNKLFSHTLNQSPAFFDKSKVGQLLTRIIHDIQTLNELFVTGLPAIFGDLFLIVCIIGISFALDYKLAIVSLSALPILVIGSLVFKTYARNSFKEIRKKLAKMNSFLQTSISGIKIIQIFNKQNRMNRIFKRIQKDYFLQYLYTVRIYSLYFPGVESFSVFSRVLLIGFGAYWVLSGETSISVLISFLLYSPMFFHPLRELSEQYNVLQAAMASSERVFELLDKSEHIPEPDNPVDLEIKGKIEFVNVSFGYKADNTIIHNLSFSIEPGEKVALVGISGSGKSTIISLLTRFYDINEGEIIIDGVNIKDIRRNQLQEAISMVLQNVFIFSDSIKENIRLFDQSIADDQVIKASHQVHAHPFIERLKGRYDSELGEGGLGLSFGEKQLISFARAFIKQSKIVIFDEATSNIDLRTEGIIQNNLEELMKDRTSIIIAHRLSTIRKVDKIIVLHNGRIKEIGSHQELIDKKGHYEKLYRLQFESQKFTIATESSQ